MYLKTAKTVNLHHKKKNFFMWLWVVSDVNELIVVIILQYIQIWNHYVACMCTQSCPFLCNLTGCSLPLLCPWDCSGKNTGVSCHFFLQGSFLTQGQNTGFLHHRQVLYHWAGREALLCCIPETNYALVKNTSNLCQLTYCFVKRDYMSCYEVTAKTLFKNI